MADLNRFCPVCLRSQPVLPAPGGVVCSVCCYRWESTIADNDTKRHRGLT